ncbi:MAG TPA: PspC domain-containing protein [Solirubrobacteraceae bacterium]|nr:PspC domain-containing protein [Solirubrobacteraceae bacterium]
MSSQAASAPPTASRREPLRRRPDEGLIGGVCAGFAHRLDVDVRWLRVFGALIAGAGGVGVVLYALLWAVIPVAPESRGLGRRPGAWREAMLTVAGVVVVLWALRRVGVALQGDVLWPVVIGVAGLALVWRPIAGDLGASTAGAPPPAGRLAAVRGRMRFPGRIDGTRVLLGVLMVSFASAALLHHYAVMRSLGKAIGAVALLTVIAVALGAPWFMRLWRSLAFERAARIREQERAEVAAHLHDSVLQTLALIQKRAADPREVAGLARRQERELRSWLRMDRADRAEPGEDTVAAALAGAAAEIEELHGVPVEVVTVGDGPLDASLQAVVQAAREALTNAAKFSGADRIDLFAEVRPDRVEVFVRDRGAGFDTQAVPEDRRGLRDSIVGRIERHNGLATVRSRPGEGTEVELQMARAPSRGAGRAGG